MRGERLGARIHGRLWSNFLCCDFMNKRGISTSLGVILSQLRRLPDLLWRLEAKFKGVEFQGETTFIGRPLISIVENGRIILGDGVIINSSTRANPLSLAHPSVLRALSTGAKLVVGRNVGLSGTILCAATLIEIGEGTIFGAGAMVIDTDFHEPIGEWGWGNDFQLVSRPIKIGRGVFVGARAIVLKGVTIGDRAVIGAGAVVSKDVPAFHCAVGNPARNLAQKIPNRST
jgi:acetyltransferase-like isoleucine patch superfamily enzyme